MVWRMCLDIDIHVFCMVMVCGGGRVRVSTTLCAPAVGGGEEEGEESPIRRGHPEQQGMATVTRMDGLR